MADITDQAFAFSLQYAAVAVWTSGAIYGSAVQFPSAQTLTLTPQYISDIAKGNSQETALAGQIVAWEWQLDGVNLTNAIVTILTGAVSSTASTDANQIDTLTVANNLSPYFGLVAQAWNQQGDDTCILIPYTKVLQPWMFKFDYGKFAAPSFKGHCIVEPTLGYNFQKKNHATKLANPVFPPSWA